ncbi:uncharacterized protein [Anabrus simplex]|uniref:uncharacterized protein n=1 Tax=Anabrus simplex TaxID=316456 RepID=UPI0034DDC6C5
MIAARIMISLCLLLFFLGSTSASHDDKHRHWPDDCDDFEYICKNFDSHHPCCDTGMTTSEIIITVVCVVAVIVLIIILLCMFWPVCLLYKKRQASRGGKVYATSPPAASAPHVATVNQTVVYPDYQQQFTVPPGQQPGHLPYTMPSGYQYPPQQLRELPPAYSSPNYN